VKDAITRLEGSIQKFRNLAVYHVQCHIDEADMQEATTACIEFGPLLSRPDASILKFTVEVATAVANLKAHMKTQSGIQKFGLSRALVKSVSEMVTV
jgi:hypothetical protein